MTQKGEVQQSQFSKDEEKVLEFWQKNKIFEKTVSKSAPRGDFVFYDGPPFATGLPHPGHMLPTSMKDAIPRYKTMRGYRVARRWGWDCHGLPIETLVQKENNLHSKKDIEQFGIKNFSKAARNSVFRYDAEWKKIIPRAGRFVDMDNQYTTMDPGFMESVWWAFKELHRKGLVYEDFKAMHISPPLETPLSNFEVNQAYKDITDISVYVKFAVVDEPQTYLLAWTTTPWTLFGNVALAVGENIEYVKVKIENDFYIIAKNRMAAALKPDFLKEKKYEEITLMTGAALVGKKYVPLFDYYAKRPDLENHGNGWKVYAGDFVTTEDGTGIVHIAPGFGEDDLKLGQKYKLPFVQHVNIDGSIKSDIPEFAGLQAKPKEDPTATDVLVIKKLAHENKLFAKEKITHSYPHCWRTDAPLLNYALSSWFVRVTDYNHKMVALNKQVRWIPSYVGEKRFGNWLSGVKDWGVSRSRYWGTPLPVWKSEDGAQVEFLGSIQDIRDRTKSTNKYFLMRHGEAEHNLTHTWSSDNSVKSNLTEKGKDEAIAAAAILQKNRPDLIYVSPLIRSQQTAEVVAKELGIPKESIITDDRITELQSGIFNGKSGEYAKYYETDGRDNFVDRPPSGENLVDVKKRVGAFIYDIDKKHQDKTILIISHYSPIHMLIALNRGLDNKAAHALEKNPKGLVGTGEVMAYDFAPIPHDDDYVLDLHRPYIDEITFIKNGKLMRRIPEVFDTWFDSGSMPFAVPHYPFETTMNPGSGFLGTVMRRNKQFPADFIAEGLDQTRGWFYTLLALNTALFGRSPYKNVIVNGLLLAEDGRKMSKRLNNYPELSSIFNKYGADPMRYFMLASPAVISEPANFSEKGVEEIYKKIVLRLLNVLAFYELYKTDSQVDKTTVSEASENILDQWITSRLNQVIDETTAGMEQYELNTACRPLFDFVDDLSTWYLRRSRDRFKEESGNDRIEAIRTMKWALNTIAKVMAPFMPFTAEMIYQRVNGFEFTDTEKSVHLESWPTIGTINRALLDQMAQIRNVVSAALLARDQAGIKVRQPLRTLKINMQTANLDAGLIDLIKDEVNVKEVVYDDTLAGATAVLDTVIDATLREEGVVRELTRFIQSIRKEKKLLPNDKIVLHVETDRRGEELITKYKRDIIESVRATTVKFAVNDGVALETDGYVFKIGL